MATPYALPEPSVADRLDAVLGGLIVLACALLLVLTVLRLTT
jgi:hypothetical protein